MTNRFHVALFLLALALPGAAQETVEPHLSYCFPAGGQRGTVTQALVGGQLLNGPKEVIVAGEGVQAVVVRSLGRIINLNGEERQEVIRRLNDARARRKDPKLPQVAPPEGSAPLPDHPLLRNIDNLSPLEENFLVSELLMRDSKRQINQQLSETVLIAITIDPDAVPGDREIRLLAQLGLSNPVVFQVGGRPELLESKPGDSDARFADPVTLPVTVNGQIRPGDADRFRFGAREGQPLVIHAQARRLVPFIADAVPGWFQATLAVFDSKGRQVAFADDWRFDPDPVLFFKVPATGEYELEIRDALWRGRADFVYRIQVDEQPFITDIFPLGGRIGEETVVTARGWNLAGDQLPIDTGENGGLIREAVLRTGDWASNPVLYAVDTLPECVESEQNNSAATAQLVKLPVIVNGRIETPGDEDFVRFAGRGGAEVVVEVLARRLNSPLDSVIWLTDPSGKVLAWNDDFERREELLRTDVGTATHHADSYLRAKLPRDGTYVLRFADAQRAGSESHAYRLRLSAPRPDFQLSVTPSAVNNRGGIAMPVTVHVTRLDGFDGPVALALKDSPPGFELQGGMIPAGRDSITLTLTPPLKDPGGAVELHIVGTARVGSAIVSRPATPCDDLMQAFLWRHLVPGRDLVAILLAGNQRVAPPEIISSLPVQIPRGGTFEITIKTVARQRNDDVTFELDDAPPGVTLVKTTPTNSGYKFEFKTTAETPPAGTEGNLIIGVYFGWGGKPVEGKPAQPKKRLGVGVLPAIPYRVAAGKP